MDIDLQSILKIFLAESEEGFVAMEQALVALESQPEDEEALGTIFRVAHTLKGNASSLGFQGVTEFAHVLEDVLGRIRDRKLSVTTPIITLLLRSVDALRQMVPGAVSGSEGMQPAHRDLFDQMIRAMAVERTPKDPSPTEQAAQVSADRLPGPGRRKEDIERDRTLRVDIDKLDRMMNLTGEIAVARGRLNQLLADIEAEAGEEIIEAHREADRLSLDLQEVIMKVRMVPLGPLFRQYVRTVRDVAAAHGKRARLVIQGEDVEVDTTVVEHVHDPLTHMIRNALDHGIEPPEIRKRLGKDPCGLLTLSAHRDAGSIAIRLADDGAGFDRVRIAARARSLGMIANPDSLSDEEIHRLVLEPGFSTSEAVTDLSGRGIGLDVVRRNVERLRGSVRIESRAGEGATITLRLPLTLAIIAGFAVGVGRETYLVPLDDVVECVELPREHCPHSDGRGVLNLRGQGLPYLRLREVFGVGGAAAGREHVVVIRHDGRLAGLAVDSLYGESQTVIKPLGALFQGLPGIAGSAILGSGRVALILDVAALARLAMPDRSDRIGTTSSGWPQTHELLTSAASDKCEE